MFALIYKQDNRLLTVTSEFLQETDEYFSLEIPEGLDLSYLKVTETDGVYSIEEDTVAEAAAAKQVLVAAAKASFDADVDAQMFVVYETKDRVVASVTHQSWSDMVLAPSDYVPAIFPSVEALQAYVTPKIAAARAFNIWRIGRLLQRDNEIAAILA